MYANLKVVATHPQEGTKATYAAWELEVLGNGSIVVHLDANEEGNYAVEAGTLILPQGYELNVQADF